ncbi:MAG: bifunctional hydroxymethylpyrimidine kinase/phosphomethylpyrimidine kinase [Bacteroidales bacterium]|nr:bifunctional hydroxymethylpyrimidine kinase/phosphomethylpyrimidine kinase [Bacteroidales bacterium]
MIDCKDKTILIVGDVMIDAYLCGAVSRLSPEAPVPIVSIERREQRLGGAANVALNVSAMGAKPLLYSVMGNDDNARLFMQLMYDNNLDRRGILTSESRRTTVKSRVIGNNMHIVRIDDEDTTPLSAVDERQLVERIAAAIKHTHIDAIIFQDYDKGNITSTVIDETIALAKRHGIITAVDPKHRQFKLFHDVTLFKPNLKELREGLNIEIDDSCDDQSLRNALDRASLTLHESQGVEVVLVTLSSRGIYACDFRQDAPQSVLLPAEHRAVADVSGAGDTVISVATLCLTLGMSLADMVAYSNKAGGIVCEQVGVVPIDKARLESCITANTKES